MPQTQLPERHASDVQRRTALFAEMQAISHRTTVPLFRAGLTIDNKITDGAGFDPVTEADRACERDLRALIETHFPDDGIIGEEYGSVRTNAPFVWVIDPIDGTRAYVAGVPLWGTLVGIMADGAPAAGFACQPFIGEAFQTGRSGAQWTKADETKDLKTRQCSTLDQAALATTTPALFAATERQAYDRLESTIRNVRYGTDWYAYALIASGTLDIVVETGLSPYDILPLVPIIEAAGGTVIDWSGNPLTSAGNGFTGQVIALGDAALAPAVLEIMGAAAK